MVRWEDLPNVAPCYNIKKTILLMPLSRPPPPKPPNKLANVTNCSSRVVWSTVLNIRTYRKSKHESSKLQRVSIEAVIIKDVISEVVCWWCRRDVN